MRGMQKVKTEKSFTFILESRKLEIFKEVGLGALINVEGHGLLFIWVGLSSTILYNTPHDISSFFFCSIIKYIQK